jgi:tetratricopeptide (TPR) repeat protein
MGEDDEARGDLDAALKKFLEAKRTTAALLADAPNDPERLFDHAQSEYWVAVIDWRRFRVDAAQAGFERYAALANRLIAINPANPDWQMEAGNADSNLGTLELSAKDDPAQAALHFARALEHFQIALRAKPENPDVLSEIADEYAWLADSEFELRHYDQARENRLLEMRLLYSLLAKDAENAEYARSLRGNALGLGRLDLAQGRVTDADKRLTAALSDAAKQAAADPDDKNLARERILIGLTLARAKLAENPVPLNSVDDLFSPCNEPVAQDDREIRDFCALLSARAGAAEGRPSQAAWNYLCLNRMRLAETHRSPKWGIDLSEELNFASKTTEGENNVYHHACPESVISR